MNAVEQVNANVAQATPAVQNAAQPQGGCIFVRTLTGNSIPISHDATTTIASIKQHISETQHIPVDQQRLIFQGKQLEDNHTLGEYEIGENASLHLVLRLRGGAF